MGQLIELRVDIHVLLEHVIHLFHHVHHWLAIFLRHGLYLGHFLGLLAGHQLIGHLGEFKV